MPAIVSDAPLLQRCHQAVLAQADALIGRCVDAARASLAEAARHSPSAAARQSAQDALDALERRGTAICAAFPVALDRALTAALDDGGGSAQAVQTAPRDLAAPRRSARPAKWRLSWRCSMKACSRV